MRQLVSSPVGFALLLAVAGGACGRSDLFSARHCVAGTPGCSPDGGPGLGGSFAGSGGTGFLGAGGTGPDGGSGSFGRRRERGHQRRTRRQRRNGRPRRQRGDRRHQRAGRHGGTAGTTGRGGTGGCASMLEICNNGKDDNCNALSDCLDPGCFGDPVCAKPGHGDLQQRARRRRRSADRLRGSRLHGELGLQAQHGERGLRRRRR